MTRRDHAIRSYAGDHGLSGTAARGSPERTPRSSCALKPSAEYSDGDWPLKVSCNRRTPSAAALEAVWNHRTSRPLSYMSKPFSRHPQVTETAKKGESLADQTTPSPKAMPSKWRIRLQRELLKIWLILSTVWVGCVLAILGQCVYGRWFGWQQPQCEPPLENPLQTYVADIGMAFGPPVTVLLTYRWVVWVSRHVRRRQ